MPCTAAGVQRSQEWGREAEPGEGKEGLFNTWGFFSPLINNIFRECVGNSGTEHHKVALQPCLSPAASALPGLRKSRHWNSGSQRFTLSWTVFSGFDTVNTALRQLRGIKSCPPDNWFLRLEIKISTTSPLIFNSFWERSSSHCLCQSSEMATLLSWNTDYILLLP